MKEKRMLLIGAILEGYRSLKDKTLKITLETQEPTPNQVADIQTYIGRFGYLAFKEDQFKSDEIEILEGLESQYDDTSKTPSQRLRSVLYVNWQHDAKGYNDFNLYYSYMMEQMIKRWKNQLP